MRNAPSAQRGGGSHHLWLDGRARFGALGELLRVALLLLAAPVRRALGVGPERHQREVVLEGVVPEVLGDGAKVEQVPGSL